MPEGLGGRKQTEAQSKQVRCAPGQEGDDFFHWVKTLKSDSRLVSHKANGEESSCPFCLISQVMFTRTEKC